MLVLIAVGLALLYAAARLVLFLWRQRDKRQLREFFRHQDEEWEAALHQIQLSRATGTSNGNGKHRVEAGGG